MLPVDYIYIIFMYIYRCIPLNRFQFWKTFLKKNSRRPNCVGPVDKLSTGNALTAAATCGMAVTTRAEPSEAQRRITSLPGTKPKRTCCGASSCERVLVCLCMCVREWVRETPTRCTATGESRAFNFAQNILSASSSEFSLCNRVMVS